MLGNHKTSNLLPIVACELDYATEQGLIHKQSAAF